MGSKANNMPEKDTTSLSDIKSMSTKNLELLPETEGSTKTTADKLKDYIGQHRELNKNAPATEERPSVSARLGDYINQHR